MRGCSKMKKYSSNELEVVKQVKTVKLLKRKVNAKESNVFTKGVKDDEKEPNLPSK